MCVKCVHLGQLVTDSSMEKTCVTAEEDCLNDSDR